jgi:FKBP-type peptidyl-prolyl cis-trans isomerase FklB
MEVFVKKTVVTLCAVLFAFCVTVSAAEKAKEGPEKETVKKETGGMFKQYMDRVSYIIGYDIGNNYFNRQDIKVNLDVFIQAVKDGLAGKTSAVSEQETRDTMMQFQTEMRAKQQKLMEEQKKKSEEQGKLNIKEGTDFLKKNKVKPGVVTLPSGLQYRVIKEGTGPTPRQTDVVRVHYAGTLISGKTFDSSYDRGTPAEFPVTGVIKGWTEALQMMKTGSIWEVVIPSELAYGERGAGQDIAPNATLIFKVELIDIVDQSKEGGQPGMSGPQGGGKGRTDIRKNAK